MPRKTSKTGTHPLLQAVLTGNFQEVKKLVSKGADINMKAPNGDKRPLHIATHVGNKAMVLALLELKADPEALTVRQFSALHVAAQTGRSDLIEELVGAVGSGRAPAYLNGPTDGGCTPLHEAAANGHQEATQRLLDLKADLTLKDYRYNLTPADLAGIKGHRGIQALLRRASDAYQSVNAPKTEDANVESKAKAPKTEQKKAVNLIAATAVNPVASASNLFPKEHVIAQLKRITPDICNAGFAWKYKKSTQDAFLIADDKNIEQIKALYEHFKKNTVNGLIENINSGMTASGQPMLTFKLLKEAILEEIPVFHNLNVATEEVGNVSALTI